MKIQEYLDFLYNIFMKPILLNRRKYNWKDIFRAIGILLIHFIAFYCYTFLFLYLKDLLSNKYFSFFIDEKNWWIIYPLTIGPLVSTITHIWYAESGKTNIRALLWLHDMTLIIAIPIVILFAI